MTDFPRHPGTYLLQFFCCSTSRVAVGSAFGPGGLAARLRHHLQPTGATPHWHLDYLRPHLRPARLWYTTDPGCWEHLWAAALAAVREVQIPHPGLGASDCRCPSHLFYRKQPLGRKIFRNRLRLAGLEPPRLREPQIQGSRDW